MALGLPAAILAGVPLTAISSGSNQSVSTALVGDLGESGRQSRRLGVLFTVGDLASAVGPLLAYALIPQLGTASLYLLAAGLFAAVTLVALRQAARHKRRVAATRKPV
jgi:MFS family permease